MTIDEDEKLLRFLELQYGRLASHAEKSWEEMKHFSAVLYVLFGAPFFFVNNFNNNFLLIIFPLLAIFVAYIAYKCIHKESNDFLDTLGTVLCVEKRLKFHEGCFNEIPANVVSEDRKGRIGINESIDDFIKRENCKPFTNSTRGWFEIYFKGLIFIGCIEIGLIIFYGTS